MSSSITHQNKVAESKAAYQKSIAPRPADQPQVKPLPPKSQEVVKKYVTHERVITYDNRASTFYHGYQPAYYHDSFSPFLMGYLTSSAMNSNQRALWVYNHRDQIDDRRYEELLAKDANLRAELDALKAAKVSVDHSYVPAQFAENPDLMYDRSVVSPDLASQALELPATVHVPYKVVPPKPSPWKGIFLFVVLVGAAVVMANILFIKQW